MSDYRTLCSRQIVHRRSRDDPQRDMRRLTARLPWPDQNGAIAILATVSYVTGAVYVPNAALTLDGAGNLSGNGACLQIVASALSFSGGSDASTRCSSLGGSSASSVTLVQ